MIRKIFFILLLLFFYQTGFSQPVPDTTYFQKYYEFGENEEIFVPLGEIAFADSIVRYKKGKPAPKKKYSDAKKALGEPDYTTYISDDPKYVSLGCGGTLIVKFDNIGFIDIEGPDLIFFEVGPSIEPFRVEISKDGKKWLKLGNVDGGKATIDIADFVKPSDDGEPEIYYYIKITDLKRICGGPTPGADMDAIGAIGAVIKLSLDAKVLFDTDKFALKEKARKALKKLIDQLKEVPKAKITVKGHTDSDGGEQYNLTLGKRRANAVKDYLENQLKNVGDYTYETESYGKSEPVDDNETDEGKQQNRRVEIIVFPDKEFYKPPKDRH